MELKRSACLPAQVQRVPPFSRSLSPPSLPAVSLPGLLCPSECHTLAQPSRPVLVFCTTKQVTTNLVASNNTLHCLTVSVRQEPSRVHWPDAGSRYVPPATSSSRGSMRTCAGLSGWQNSFPFGCRLRSPFSCRLSAGCRSAPRGHPRSLPCGPSMGALHFQADFRQGPVPCCDFGHVTPPLYARAVLPAKQGS